MAQWQAQHHQSMPQDFDGWALEDSVGWVEFEAAAVDDQSEGGEEHKAHKARKARKVQPAQKLRQQQSSGGQGGQRSRHTTSNPAGNTAGKATGKKRMKRVMKVKRSRPKKVSSGAPGHPSRPMVAVDTAAPGVLAEPIGGFMDPFAPVDWEGEGADRRSPYPASHPARTGASEPEGVTVAVAVRILRQFVVWRLTLLWKLAWLGTAAVGSAMVVVAVARWQPAETFAEVGLREECLGVTNGEVVPEDRSKGAAQWIGKGRQELTKQWGAPYCQLPKTSVRSGAILDRSLYQLEGDRQMVVAFEGDRTIGYGIDPPASGNGHGTGDRQDFDLRQNWGWLPNIQVADRTVVGGLGSIALAMDGPVHAPMDGVVYEQAALVAQGQLVRLPSSCAVFTSVQMPAYALQLCGLRDRQVGAVKRGQVLGHSRNFLHFAVLRQEGAQWMFVPPSPEIVEQVLGTAA